MKMRKVLIIGLICLLAAQSVMACTIFAIGKKATIDGSTMTSHTCDSTSDDLRLWIIPSMPAGTVRDIVLDGRAGADYSQFPEVKNYGTNGLALAQITYDKPTNQYIHGMYSFINDKGLAMGESTCSYNRNSEQGQKLKKVYDANEGIIDCYMLQDYALETCSTAREAVQAMTALVEEFGWNGTPECINICDGNEAWVVEFYGGHIYVGFRVPDDEIFVCANRARINHIDWDDTENWVYPADIKDFAIENDLWDGKGEFVPCRIFAPYPQRPYSTRREWRAMTLLNPSLDIKEDDPDHDYNWPLTFKPAKPVSVEDIRQVCSDYYVGTEFDLTQKYASGPYGNPLYPNLDRSINCYRCTYIWISNIKSWLPDDAKCLAYFGWAAPDSTYMTPIFASQTSLPSFFGTGTRAEYDENSGFWVSADVQIMASQNYMNAIEDIRALRDPLMAAQYETTFIMQNIAAKMIREGNTEGAVALLTAYANQTATSWFNTWKDLSRVLEAKYLFGNINQDGSNNRVPQASAWWKENVTGKGLQ